MYNLITVLKEEHQQILRFIDSLEGKCIDLMENNNIDYAAFREGIAFIREYADRTHHQKEEQILFRVMTETLGPVAVNLIQHGMLVEHDLARLHVAELEQALARFKANGDKTDKLCILANAMGYCYLLRRHIEKEDNVVYPYAEKNLSAEQLAEINLIAQSFA